LVRGFARFVETWMVGNGWAFGDSFVGGDTITVGAEAGGLSVGAGDCAAAFSGIPAINTTANADLRNALDMPPPTLPDAGRSSLLTSGKPRRLLSSTPFENCGGNL
jgi:hypothetical protein